MTTTTQNYFLFGCIEIEVLTRFLFNGQQVMSHDLLLANSSKYGSNILILESKKKK